jgi:hypothetical protein
MSDCASAELKVADTPYKETGIFEWVFFRSACGVRNFARMHKTN